MGAAKGPLSGLGRLVSALAGRGRAAAEKGAEAEDTQVAPAAASREAGEKGEVTPGAPATAETETEAAPSESALDMAALVRELLGSREPLGRLRGFVTDVEGRAAGDASRQDALLPCGRERHLARRLREAGLFDDDVELPGLRVIQPRMTGLVYLRVTDRELPYLAKLRVMALEAALNEALLSQAMPGADPAAGERDLVRDERLLRRSIAEQARTLGPATEPDDGCGEWGCRRALAYGIEAFQLPFRLKAGFRVNAGAGAAAFELALVPPRVMPGEAWVDELGVVAATGQMRRQMASDYNLRLGLLVAAWAFEGAPTLNEVWVAGTLDTATSHECLYWGRLTRSDLEGIDLGPGLDPAEALRAAGVAMDLDDGALLPVRQGFSLEDELFCPPARYDAPETSDRELPAEAARALGASCVADLGIDEACRRTKAADELTRGITGSTEGNVRLLMSLMTDGADPAMDAACRRVMEGLIEGTLPDDDPLAVAEELARGDALSRAVELGTSRMMAKDVAGAGRAVLDALAPVEDAGTYADGDDVAWRAFGSYVDRVLYNRLTAGAGTRTRLAPAALYQARLIASQTELIQGKAESARGLAAGAAHLAPLSAEAALQLSNCLSALGDNDGATETVRRMLAYAHDSEAIGMGYIRMAQLQWERDRPRVARACLQRAREYVPGPLWAAGMQVMAIMGHALDPEGEPTAEEARAALLEANVPLAPTKRVSEVFFEGLRASLDQEIFPVARDFMSNLGTMSRDDVYFGILRSLEDAPDR